MLITSKPSKSKLPPIEEGTYSGYMVWAVSIGEHPHFEDKSKIQNKILTAYEIPELNTEEGDVVTPRLVFKEYTWSANEKSALCKHALTINKDAVDVGKSIDISKLLGRPVGITLSQNEAGYNKVESVSKLRESAVKAIDPMASKCWTFNPFDAKSKTDGIAILGKHIIDKIMGSLNSDDIKFTEELTERLNELEEQYRKFSEERESAEAAKPKAKSNISKPAKKEAPKQEDEDDLHY